MSWSVSTKINPKSAIEQAVNNLTLASEGFVPSGPELDQLEAAKRGALEILKSVPGPFVQVQLVGHATGVGWQKKDGYSNEFISVSVYQRTEEPPIDQ